MELRTLARTEARLILSLEAADKDEVDLEDIQRLAEVSYGHARKLAHTLVRKSWLQSIGRGRYLLNPARHGPDAIPDTDAYRVGAHLVQPYYFAYSTAATLHGLATQVGRVYYVATPKRKTTTLKQPAEYRIVTVTPRKFFGHETRHKGSSEIHVSDVEKTLLDCLDRPDLCGGMAGVAQILLNVKPRTDTKRLLEYVDRLDNHSLTQRLGYLWQRIRPTKGDASFLRALRERRGKSHVPLAPASNQSRWGPWDHDWLIRVNVEEGLLLSEAEPR